MPGTHTVIQIPAAQLSGVYTIKANATGANADSGIVATYLSSSTVRATATTHSPNYKVGDAVILSGLVFDNATPVVGAIMTAAVSAPVSVAAQTTVGNFQLVSQQTLTPTVTDYMYSARLTNTGAAMQSVRAGLASFPADVTVMNDTLVFGDIAANSSATSLNKVTIERNPNQSFDPATLQWNV